MNIHNRAEAADNPANLMTPEAIEKPFAAAVVEISLVQIAPAGAVAVTKGRSIGFLKGDALIPDDFDRMGEDEILALFEGET
jgi:hypothetical protein